MQRCLKPVLSSRKAAECSGGARVFAGRWHSAMPPGYVSGLAGLCHLRCTYCSARTFGTLIDTLRLDTCIYIYICICTYDIYICYIDIREGAHMCLFTAASQAPRCKARTTSCPRLLQAQARAEAQAKAALRSSYYVRVIFEYILLHHYTLCPNTILDYTYIYF